MTAHEPLRPLTRHAISPPSNMIIPFSNSISPMETSLPVCPFRQGRFPFAGDLLRTFQAFSFEGKAAPHGTVAARRKYRRSAMPPLCKGRWRRSAPCRRGCRYRPQCKNERIHPTVSLTAASSLCTGEPRGAGRTYRKKRSPRRRQSSPPDSGGLLLLSAFLHPSARTSVPALARGSDARRAAAKNRRIYAPAVNPRP